MNTIDNSRAVVSQVREALNRFDAALAARQHGDVAAHRFVDEARTALALDIGGLTEADADAAVRDLITWLHKRGEPDSGIRYASNDSFTGRARVELHGTDASFVADHFHGEGARQLAAVLAATLASNSPGIPNGWTVVPSDVTAEWAERFDADRGGVGSHQNGCRCGECCIKAALAAAPAAPAHAPPIKLDVAGSALFVAKVQAAALLAIAVPLIEELSKRPQTHWGEIIHALRKQAHTLSPEVHNGQ